MTCNTNIPLTDIVEAVIDKLDLDQFAKAVGGVLTDPTFKGSITLDKKAKESLCTALASCLDDAITNFSLSGDDLTIVTADGSVHTVSLEKYMTDADAKRMADALKAQIKDDFLATAVLRGTQLRMTMNSGLIRTVDLSELAKDSTVGGMVMDGNTLVVNLTDGTQQRIDLSRFANPAPVLPVTSGGVTGTGASNNHIRLNLGNGLTLTPDGKLTLNLGDGLTIKDGRVSIDDDGICTQTVKAVNTYTALSTDELLLSSGGTITFPASVPVGKQYTVIQTTDSDVTLVGQPTVYYPGGGAKLGGKHSAATVIKATATEWYVIGDTTE